MIRIMQDVGLVLVGCFAMVVCIAGIVLLYPILVIRRIAGII